jgi:hypothetical protein
MPRLHIITTVKQYILCALLHPGEGCNASHAADGCFICRGGVLLPPVAACCCLLLGATAAAAQQQFWSSLAAPAHAARAGSCVACLCEQERQTLEAHNLTIETIECHGV